MKVKELLKTVNVAWSPQAQNPILLAAGTAAQQLDASFNTSASLDLYSLNLQQSGYDMELKSTIQSDHRFHKIVWGPYGTDAAGIIVGGCDHGTIKIYSAAKVIARESDCLLSSPDRHTGPVRALDFNPFQSNLLASGATESEIYIWDIVNTNTPMTPGTRSQPAEDVLYIQWNQQVQHILASTFPQRCVIWDLRKNEPIIKLSDGNSKIRWKVLQWHPEVATQLCLASEDDQTPIIQLWDLRFATSPLKTLHHHQRGVLSIAWNTHDPDLLLSCAKDNSILCWNPNADVPNEQLLGELTQTNQWNFDVSWCPRSPGLIVGSSFDGHATVYSLLGGQQQASSETSNQILDSFPGMDPFTQSPPVVHPAPAVMLKKAPKWLKKRAGASFGFGGKLTIFDNEAVDPNSGDSSRRKILVSQVITNPDLIKRSDELEMALKCGQFMDYCQGKVDNSLDEHSKNVWNYIGAYFSQDVTRTFLDLLGYNVLTVNNKFKPYVLDDDVKAITDGVRTLDNIQNGNTIDGTAAFDVIAQQEQIKNMIPSKTENTNFEINTSDDEDGLITQAILIGNIEAAVSLCFACKRYADAVVLSMAGGPDLLAKTQYRYFSERSGTLNSLINSVVSENWNDIVQNCNINCWKEMLVGIFTHTSTEECSALCDVLGDRLAMSDDLALKKQSQLCYICSGNLNKVVGVSEMDLQDTVELVMIMKQALELQGPYKVPTDGNIAEVLSQYAEALASEGHFQSALNYVSNGQDGRITMLRDRLYKALAPVQSGPLPTLQQSKNVSQNYYDPSRVQQNVYPQTVPVQQPMQTWNTSPLQNSYVMGHMGQSSQIITPAPPPSFQTMPQQVQPPLSNMKAYQPPMQAPQAPPPPPTQAISGSNFSGSRPSSVGPQSRPKYMIDPSVKSTPTYRDYGQQSQMFNSSQPMMSFPGQNSYQSQVPTIENHNSNQHSIYSGAEPDHFKSPLQPNIMTPILPPSESQGKIYDPTRSQPQSQQGQSYTNEPVYQAPPQPSGWNDPPVAKSSRVQPVMALCTNNEMSAEHAGTRKWKAKHSKSNINKVATEIQAQNPILHPLCGAMPQREFNGPEESYHQEPQMQYNQQQYGRNIYEAPNQYVKPFEPMNPMQPMQPMQLNQPMQPRQPMQSMQPVQVAKIAEPEKPKVPIPEEHMHLKTIFDELRVQCYESAKNPQTKRKIDDVSRKLESLYDCLRENTLSPNTLQGLHQIAELIQSGSYANGLSIHTQLVSGPDFSQIATFMPGIKVLLQCALQLGVYLT